MTQLNSLIPQPSSRYYCSVSRSYPPRTLSIFRQKRNEMKRRHLLRKCTLGVMIGLTSCQSTQKTGITTQQDHNKILALSPSVRRTSNRWELKIIATNEYDWDTSLYDVEVVAYTTDGTKVCEAHVGDLLSSGDFQRTVKMTCSRFPAIVTATMRETPCEKASIPVLRWTGTDLDKGAGAGWRRAIRTVRPDRTNMLSQDFSNVHSQTERE